MELGLGEGAPNTWGQSSGVLAYYFRRSGCKGKRRALMALDSRGGSLVHEAPEVLRKVKTVMLGKTVPWTARRSNKSILKEINLMGGRVADANAEAEAPILWPPDAKTRLIWKTP